MCWRRRSTARWPASRCRPRRTYLPLDVVWPCADWPEVLIAQVLLNVLADEIHRAHQRCTHAAACDPLLATRDLVIEAGANSMRMLQGAYSCLCLIKSVGLVAFRDPFGIRRADLPGTRALHISLCSAGAPALMVEGLGA